MSTDLRPAAPASDRPDHDPADGAAATRGRRWMPTWARWVLVVVLVGAVVVAATILLAPDATNENPGDPENVGPGGTAALVAVARAQGIDVEVARGRAGLESADLGPETTVVVAPPAALGSNTGRELLAATAGAAGVVLLDADERAIEVLELPVQVAFSDTASRAACEDPLAREDPALPEADLLAYLPTGDGATVCFPAPGDDVGDVAPGTLVRLPATDERAPVTLFGAGGALTNDQVTVGDNAGIGLRLLFPTERVVWYVPMPTDDLTAAQSIGDALPDATTPVLWVLGASVLALALVQGRRLGPLVRESLPVVVRSTETTLHRSRLYRQARDHRRAAAALQAGARHRLRERLALGPHADPEQVLLAVAERTGRPVADLRAVLTDPDVPDEKALMSTARRLAELEEEVHP